MTPEDRVERLVRESAPALLGFLVRRCSPATDAADLLSEVFVVLWRRRGDLPADERAALSFAFGVARRVLANEHRGQRRRDDLTRRLAASLPTETAVDSSCEAGPGILDALEGLNDADRELLMTAGGGDLSVTEIAALLGITPEAVRQRIHRPRGRLRQLLDQGCA